MISKNTSLSKCYKEKAPITVFDLSQDLSPFPLTLSIS